MSPGFFVCLAVLFGVAALGAPIPLAIIGSSIVYLAVDGRDLGLAAEQMLQGVMNNFIILAVPLFILAAAIMNASTIGERLMDFCMALVGRYRGGLAYLNILTSVIFSGMSGSAVADVAGIGKITTDIMTKGGRYSPGYSGALTAATAAIGPLIPPSIPLVMYALVSDVSIGYLFLGAIVPGLLLVVVITIQTFFLARVRNFPVEAPVPIRKLPGITARAVPALLMPVILLGGIYSGIVTPTEAAAVAALYALLLAVFFYRAFTWRSFYAVLLESARSSAGIGLLIGSAVILNYIVASENVPAIVGDTLAEAGLSPLGFMIIVNVVLLFLGTLLDVAVIILVIMPIFIPTATALGIDPIYFGVIAVTNAMIGLITPPFGMMLFVTNAAVGIPMRAMVREIWQFIVILIAALLLMILFPDTILWLPRQLGYGS